MTTSAEQAPVALATRARIDDLRLDVVRLGSLVTGAIAAASHALGDSDLDEAARIVDDDDEVDAQRHAIEDECLRLLGDAGPDPRLDPREVRFVACTLRVAHELERSADLMVNVARTTLRLYATELDESSRSLIRRLGRQAALQIRVAVNALVDGDLVSAAALPDMDDALDEMHDLLVRRALVRPVDRVDDAVVLRAVQLTLVARHYERAGDHAVTIAEFVPFVVTGERVRRPHST